MDPSFPNRMQRIHRPQPWAAIIALLFGIFALLIPIPIIDLVLGVLGIALAIFALYSGVNGLGVVALVFAAQGTMTSILYNLQEFGIWDPFGFGSLW